MTILVFLIGCFASAVFGACVMYAIMDIWMLQRKVERLKRKIKKMQKEVEPEVVRIIDITPDKEEEK